MAETPCKMVSLDKEHRQFLEERRLRDALLQLSFSVILTRVVLLVCVRAKHSESTMRLVHVKKQFTGIHCSVWLPVQLHDKLDMCLCRMTTTTTNHSFCIGQQFAAGHRFSKTAEDASPHRQLPLSLCVMQQHCQPMVPGCDWLSFSSSPCITKLSLNCSFSFHTDFIRLVCQRCLIVCSHFVSSFEMLGDLLLFCHSFLLLLFVLSHTHFCHSHPFLNHLWVSLQSAIHST